MWNNNIARSALSVIGILWKIIWPVILATTMIAIVIFVFMTMGLIQLQLQFHQRLLQDTRLNREIVRLLVDQLVTIDDFEYNKGIKSHLSTVLQLYSNRDTKRERAGLKINLLCSAFIAKMQDLNSYKFVDNKGNNLGTQVAGANTTVGPSLDQAVSSVDKAKQDPASDQLTDYLTYSCASNIYSALSNQRELTSSIDAKIKDFRRKLLKEVYNYAQPSFTRAGYILKPFDELLPDDDEYSGQLDNLVEEVIVSYNDIDFEFKQIDASTSALRSDYIEYCTAIASYTKMASENNADILLSALRARWTRSKCNNIFEVFTDQPQLIKTSVSDPNASPLRSTLTPSFGTQKTDTDQSSPTANTVNLSIEAQSDELVAAYRFYREARWIGVVFDYLITAPIDLSFIVIVFFASILGSMLRLVYEDVQDQKKGVSTTQSTIESRYRYRSEQLIVGVMVSLLFYILSRTALISLLDRSVSENTFALNPYLVAFVAAVAGILSNETFDQIIATGRSIFKSPEANVAKGQPVQEQTRPS